MEKPWGKRNIIKIKTISKKKKTVAVIYDFVYDYKLVK